MSAILKDREPKKNKLTAVDWVQFIGSTCFGAAIVVLITIIWHPTEFRWKLFATFLIIVTACSFILRASGIKSKII